MSVWLKTTRQPGFITSVNALIDWLFRNGDGSYRILPPLKTINKKLAKLQDGLISRKLVTFADGLGKIRYIAIADWLTQLTLFPLAEVLIRILKNLDTDYTYDQERSIKTSKHFFKLGKKMFCFDLSAATDRMPLLLQAFVLNQLGLPVDGVKAWIKIMVLQPFLYQGKILTYRTGQGMGIYRSWPSMAVTHHLLVILSAYRAGRKDWSSFKDYIILGDDVVIACPHVAAFYKVLITSLGIGISDTKSVYPTTGYNSSEFASKFVINGTDCRPLPLGLIFKPRLASLLMLLTSIWKQALECGVWHRLSSVWLGGDGPVTTQESKGFGNLKGSYVLWVLCGSGVAFKTRPSGIHNITVSKSDFKTELKTENIWSALVTVWGFYTIYKHFSEIYQKVKLNIDGVADITHDLSKALVKRSPFLGPGLSELLLNTPLQFFLELEKATAAKLASLFKQAVSNVHKYAWDHNVLLSSLAKSNRLSDSWSKFLSSWEEFKILLASPFMGAEEKIIGKVLSLVSTGNPEFKTIQDFLKSDWTPASFRDYRLLEEILLLSRGATGLFKSFTDGNMTKDFKNWPQLWKIRWEGSTLLSVLHKVGGLHIMKGMLSPKDFSSLYEFNFTRKRVVTHLGKKSLKGTCKRK